MIYDEFKKVYSTRPIQENVGGLNFFGMFGLWTILNSIKPKFVIESGVWKGGSTWLIDQIKSVEKIICIDPMNKEWYPGRLSYVSVNAEYITTDFLEVDFSKFKDFDISKCCVFFDDHQDILPRLLRCKELGISDIIMDDNYKSLLGSHKTLYCLQHLINDPDFKKIKIKKEINFDCFYLDDAFENQYNEAINNNLTYIKI